MSVKIKGQGRAGGNQPISQISNAELKKRLSTTTGRHKVNILNELDKRGA